ncbi:MAG: phosphoribosyltransferase [Actinomycetota bacterium]
MRERVFKDRADAGRVLASRLEDYRGDPQAIVLALPRGGVPVGYEVARALDLPLDVFLVRKLGTPGREELAMGAIASGGVRVLNEEVVTVWGIPEDVIEAATKRETAELERRNHLYREGYEEVALEGKSVILVDDGLATGSTMRAAVEAVREHRPNKIVVAVPTAAANTCEELARSVDEVICVMTPEPFQAVGLWYEDFAQTGDGEIRDLLARARSERGAEG